MSTTQDRSDTAAMNSGIRRLKLEHKMPWPFDLQLEVQEIFDELGDVSSDWWAHDYEVHVFGAVRFYNERDLNQLIAQIRNHTSEVFRLVPTGDAPPL